MGFFACDTAQSMVQLRPAISWEEPRCLLCQSSRNVILLEAADPVPARQGLWFAVAQCQDCGLCYTNPRPDAESMARFYPATTRAEQARASKHGKRFAWLARKGSQPFEHIARIGQCRLLDIGCGSGSFLLRMQQRGWQVAGFEMIEANAQKLRAELKLPIATGLVPGPELGQQCYDCITIRHALEKAPQPLEMLRACLQLLAPGGKLMVLVPNIDSLPFKWFGRFWRGLDLPRNLTHFTPDTLQLILARVGFEVGAVRMVRRAAWLQQSARLAWHQANTSGWRKWLRGGLFANLATWYAYLARRCDAMIVTATTRGHSHSSTATFTYQPPERPPLPGDRWHNR